MTTRTRDRHMIPSRNQRRAWIAGCSCSGIAVVATGGEAIGELLCGTAYVRLKRDGFVSLERMRLVSIRQRSILCSSSQEPRTKSGRELTRVAVAAVPGGGGNPAPRGRPRRYGWGGGGGGGGGAPRPLPGET